MNEYCVTVYRDGHFPARCQMDNLKQVHEFISKYLNDNVGGIHIRYVTGRDVLNCSKHEYIHMRGGSN